MKWKIFPVVVPNFYFQWKNDFYYLDSAVCRDRSQDLLKNTVNIFIKVDPDQSRGLVLNFMVFFFELKAGKYMTRYLME